MSRMSRRSVQHTLKTPLSPSFPPQVTALTPCFAGGVRALDPRRARHVGHQLTDWCGVELLGKQIAKAIVPDLQGSMIDPRVSDVTEAIEPERQNNTMPSRLASHRVSSRHFARCFHQLAEVIYLKL